MNNLFYNSGFVFSLERPSKHLDLEYSFLWLLLMFLWLNLFFSYIQIFDQSGIYLVLGKEVSDIFPPNG